MVFKFIKAVKNVFSMLVLAAVVLIGENAFAKSVSLERYHVLLAKKYGYNVFDVTSTQVTNPDRIQLMKEISEQTRYQLVAFASSIDADVFTYTTNNDFWRLNNGNRVLSYTFSIDIIKNDVKLFDYYCFAILENRENRGFTVGCSAYDFTAT